MPGSGFKAERLRVNLRLAINRLKLLEKKKTELAEKARKEIADYLISRKDERARIRVEHIIREDFLVEAMELLELYCDLLLARFGLIQSMKELDPGLAEAVSSLIWAAPRMLEISELKVVSKQLCAKYSKEYGVLCRSNQIGTVGPQLISKLSTQAPPRILVERYLIEIAKTYNVPYETDSAVMEEPRHGLESGPCDVTDDLNKRGPGSGGGGGGGFTNTPFSYPSSQNQAKTPQGFEAGPSDVGFIDDVIKPDPGRGGEDGGGFPNTPFSHLSTHNQDAVNGAAVGTYMAWSPSNFQPPQDRELPKIPDTAAIYEPVDYPTPDKKAPPGPVAAPRTKLKPSTKPAPDSSSDYDNITLPSVPVTPPSADFSKNISGPDDDFADLAKRLEDLKKKT